MSLSLYNTLGKKKVAFEPREPGVVRMYNCGPTVYNYAHIGNFRSFMLADLLRRYLEYQGLEVHQVMNITDVGHLTQDDIDEGEDKIEKAAREKQIDPYEIVDRYTQAFMEDLAILNMKSAREYPRATQHIPEMLASIATLIERGHAYEVDGEVYYDVKSFGPYGNLSGNTVENLEAGARVELDPKKRSPYDFALWKKDEKHLMQWDSPYGRGFPGWHIECSSMSKKYLGDTLDLHTGGEDNIFPHHECEIAQAEGETGETFVRYWVHARHLFVDGEKMSKSKGNFYTLRDLLEKGLDGLAIRYALVSTHYRQPYNLTLEGLEGAAKAQGRLNDFVRRMNDRAEDEGEGGEIEAYAAQAVAEFERAMDDDLNTSAALAAVHNFCREVNRVAPRGKGARAAVDFLKKVDGVFGVLGDDSGGEAGLDADIDALVQERQEARKNKDFARSDEIRDQLKAMGIALEDTPEGVRWKRG